MKPPVQTASTSVLRHYFTLFCTVSEPLLSAQLLHALLLQRRHAATHDASDGQQIPRGGKTAHLVANRVSAHRLSVHIRVFAIYQIMLGWKNI